MDSTNVVCPVCTLFLRPGITLKSHLTSHPKQKVIDALVNLTNITNNRNDIQEVVVSNSPSQQPSTSQTNTRTWNQPITGFPTVPGNHSFIYQQFMTSNQQFMTATQQSANANPLAQQYVIPTVFNPQMICSPYVYQQQQVIMSAGAAMVSMPPQFIKKSPMINSCENQEASISNSGHTSQDIHPIEIQTASQRIREINEIGKDAEADVVIIGDSLPSPNDITSILPISQSPRPVSIDDLADNEKVEEINEKKEEEEIEIENYQVEDFNDSENTLNSPEAVGGSDYLRVRTDLNKTSRAHKVSHINIVENIHVPDPEQIDDSTLFNAKDQLLPETTAEVISLPNDFEPDAANYPPSNDIGIQQPNDEVIDMDGMQLVLCNDFMGSQLISQVEDFECMNSRSERTVLMNIGGMDGGVANTLTEPEVNLEHLAEESMSRESANVSIHADERMPPRGELSGQESNGASDIAWNRLHYDGSSATSTSYDLLARETWDGSDCSDTDVPPLQSRGPSSECYNPDLDDTPTIVSVTEPPLNFKCPACGQGFKCPKERRVHQTEMHSDRNENSKQNNNAKSTIDNNVIGCRVGNKKGIKKIVIKPKKSDVKNENNFDNVFTNKLKLDSSTEGTETKDASNRASVIAAVSSECDLDEKKDLKYCICSICDAICPDNKTLRKHKLEIHGKGAGNRYKCDTCGENMKNEPSYIQHLKHHPLECRMCGKYFYRRQNLQLHMKRHLGIKPHMCDFCQKSFLTKQKLEEHKNIHTGEAPIKCNMCNETFRRHSNLVQHRNRHHLNIKRKVKDYVCYCGEVLHSKKKLAWHKEIHDPKPKACTQCSEKFVHMASLTRHVRRAHNERFVPKEERNNENVECPICKGVYLKSSLEVHIRNHSGHRPHTCLICNKDFTTKWNLKLHRWTHAARASKPFKCDQCKGAFIREADYVAHINSHRSVRPYTCNHCGAQFIRKYNCQRHVREHEKDKTFSCQICAKTFHRSYYLKDHMRVHSGIRPFSCHICGKTSTTKSNHNKHIMIHHAKEPVSTEN